MGVLAKSKSYQTTQGLDALSLYKVIGLACRD